MNHYNRAHMKNIEPTKSYRSLCECELYTSMYDDDPEMKEIMHDFDRQTSRRFEEYEQRMITNRQKYKEQCDKDIQEIIVKDKIQNSLAEKVEKGCLRCGCGLGGVAAGVGIFGAITVNEMKKAALVAAAQKGIDAGIAKAIAEVISKFGLHSLNDVPLQKIITASNFNKPMFYVEGIMRKYNSIECTFETTGENGVLCFYKTMPKGNPVIAVSQNARNVAIKAGEEAAKITSEEITAANTASYNLYLAIAYSVIAIVVIVLVMILKYKGY
ncbi:rifin [Plasmodium falciparum RAJ116]|uniref:Rifin n=1 Tax=Plasmodium falciparum RAJ116 TaxID=580058 RepID=A0A0L0CU62_PLAFA|nr:rifin [Plasmodium falciparum RAJ116]